MIEAVFILCVSQNSTGLQRNVLRPPNQGTTGPCNRIDKMIRTDA